MPRRITSAIPLQHLIDMPEDLGAYEPSIERAPIETLVKPAATTRAELKAKVASLATLFQHGMEASISGEEETLAMQQFNREIQQLPIQAASLTTPAVVLKLTALLSEYDHEVVRDASQMRTYVTNRLIEESDPKQPGALRLRALDMLGKINGVDLFTERTEITVRTMPLENLEAQLHAKLRILLPEEVEEIKREQDSAQ